MRMPPAALRRAVTVLSSRGTWSASGGNPVVVRMPAVAWASFSVKGTPCSGPHTSPRANALSASRARSYARSASIVMMAFRAGLWVSICAKCASSTSVAETWPARMAAANCVVLEKTISIVIAPLVYGHQSLGLWHGRVEKRRNHRQQPIGAFDKRYMRRAREHRELGTWETDDIACHASAEQSEHLYSMLRADDIGIPDDNQGRHLDRLNGLGWPVRDLPIQLLHFGDQCGPIFRIRCDPGIFFLERGPSEGFGRDGFDSREDPRVKSVTVVGDCGDHKLAHQIRVLDSDLQGDAGSHAIAEDVGIFDSDMMQQSGRVLRHLLDGQRAINVSRAPMGLLFDGDDLPGLGKGRQQLSERGADCRQSAMQQNQRPTGAMDLVIHFETVHRSVAALGILAPFIRVLDGALCHADFPFLSYEYVSLLLYDTEPKMGDPGGFDHLRAFQFNVLSANMLEQADTFTEQHGHE